MIFVMTRIKQIALAKIYDVKSSFVDRSVTIFQKNSKAQAVVKLASTIIRSLEKMVAWMCHAFKDLPQSVD